MRTFALWERLVSQRFTAKTAGVRPFHKTDGPAVRPYPHLLTTQPPYATFIGALLSERAVTPSMRWKR